MSKNKFRMVPVVCVACGLDYTTMRVPVDSKTARYLGTCPTCRRLREKEVVAL